MWISGARSISISVPGQVAVTRFNDLAGSDEMLPSLTTVRTPRQAIGEESARMLLALMRGETPERNGVDLGFELTVREST
jgi:LacI family gluconate utilization system Gnt-I transcriptional repressor